VTDGDGELTKLTKIPVADAVVGDRLGGWTNQDEGDAGRCGR
jgi:hypothetical protein